MSAAEDALRSAFASVVLADRSDLARLRATGPDFLGLLQRLSTNDLRGLAPGQGRPTVLTSPKGRIVERLFLHHLGPAGVLAVGGAASGPHITAHLARYTFAERTGLAEITAETRLYALLGPRAAEALAAAGLARPEPDGALAAEVAGHAVHVLGQDGSSRAGFSVLTAAGDATAVEAALAEAVRATGGSRADPEVVESYRVLRGIPAPGHELTEDHNPLEAGLWEAVSFAKGCYVGQEVVARLRTYDKIASALVGIDLLAEGELPATPAPLYCGERRAGTLTSLVHPPGRPHAAGLAYVKRREAGPGSEVRLGSATTASCARVVELPFE